MKKNKLNGIVIDILIGIIILALFFALYPIYAPTTQMLFEGFLSNLSFSEYLGLVTTQFSTTFLIVSLLSLLSVRGQYIYWEEAVEYKIILPAHFNFISSSIYAFLTLLGSILALFAEQYILVLVFFMINALILTFLTFRMTSIFFDRDTIAGRLKKEILELTSEYAKTEAPELYTDISGKLNALYENTYKMASEKDYKQIIDDNVSLLLELSEQLNSNYNNNLAKLYYSTLSRVFMIFQNDSNYFLNVIYYKFSPFEGSTFSKHTTSMLQNALYDLFEAILRSNQYRVAYDYWIQELYKHLVQNYLKFLKQKCSTGFFSGDKYVNYEGEELFVKYDSDSVELRSLVIADKRFTLVEEKYVVFCQLLAQCNSTLLLQLIHDYDMPLDIMEKISLLQILSSKDHSELSELVFTKYLNKQYLFTFEEHVANYEDYRSADEFMRNAHAKGSMAWTIYEMHLDKIYVLNPTIIELLHCCIHNYNDAWMVWMILTHIQTSLVNIASVILDYKKNSDTFAYPLLLNKGTEQTIIQNAYIANADALLPHLYTIDCKMPLKNIQGITRGLIELCEGKIDILTFAETYCSQTNRSPHNLYLREDVFKMDID